MKQVIFVLLMLTLAMAGGLTVDWSRPVGVHESFNVHPEPLYQITEITAGCPSIAECNPTVSTSENFLGAVKVDFTGITDAYAGQIAVAGLKECYIQDCALLGWPSPYDQCEVTPPENYATAQPWDTIDTEGYVTHLMFKSNVEEPGYCDFGASWPPSWPDTAPPCPNEGERWVLVTCNDNAGNIASQLQDSINLDMIDPTQSISYTGGSIIAPTATIFTTESDIGVHQGGLGTNDGKVQVDSKDDGGNYGGWTDVGSCTTLADCVYTFPNECKWYKFRYRVRDIAGRPLDEWAYAHNPGTEIWHDKTAPSTLTIGGAPAWQNTDATATIASCIDNCGCDTSTYAFKVYEQENEPTCSQTYGDYAVGPSMPVTAHAWVCAAAKDDAGNTKFSDPVEFNIDKVGPGAPSIIDLPYDDTGLPEIDWGAATDYGDQGGTGEAAGIAQYRLQIARDDNWVTDPAGTDDDGVDVYVADPATIYDTNNYATKHNCAADTPEGGEFGMNNVVLCQGGWAWRVCAQDAAGNWGDWAESVPEP